MSKTLLIDGDILLYQYACTNEETIDWGDGLESSSLDLEAAKDACRAFISDLQESTETTKEAPIICFSCPKEQNFRYTILPTYKHNRKDKQKPTLYYDLKKWVEENYQTKQKPCIEADDTLGILATLHPGKYVIASLDKDLKQIAGTHYNWRNKDYFEVSPQMADYFFYMQVLTGDPCDCYSGCPGIGKKRAIDILRNFSLVYPDSLKESWEDIVLTYEKKGLTEEDALQQARCARILTKDLYDFKRKEPILWRPY